MCFCNKFIWKNEVRVIYKCGNFSNLDKNDLDSIAHAMRIIKNILRIKRLKKDFESGDLENIKEKLL